MPHPPLYPFFLGLPRPATTANPTEEAAPSAVAATSSTSIPSSEATTPSPGASHQPLNLRSLQVLRSAPGEWARGLVWVPFLDLPVPSSGVSRHRGAAWKMGSLM